MGDYHTMNVPLTAAITSSAKTCYNGGDPPFTVSIKYRCDAQATIWALRPLLTDFFGGVEIRDPTRRNQRIGPTITGVGNEDGTEDDILINTELLRLDPGSQIITNYTFTTQRKANGLRHNDFHNLTVGNVYDLTVWRQQWRWMFESDAPENCTAEERWALLARQPAVDWKPECTASFVLAE